MEGLCSVLLVLSLLAGSEMNGLLPVMVSIAITRSSFQTHLYQQNSSIPHRMKSTTTPLTMTAIRVLQGGGGRERINAQQSVFSVYTGFLTFSGLRPTLTTFSRHPLYSTMVSSTFFTSQYYTSYFGVSNNRLCTSARYSLQLDHVRFGGRLQQHGDIPAGVGLAKLVLHLARVHPVVLLGHVIQLVHLRKEK